MPDPPSDGLEIPEWTAELIEESRPPPPAQLALTVRQVADMFGMSPKAVYHRAERGQLPGAFRVGRSLRFRRADLLRFIAEGRGLSPTRSR